MTTRNCGSLNSLGALWELLRELTKNKNIKHTHTHKNTQSIKQSEDSRACLNVINMEIQSVI